MADKHFYREALGYLPPSPRTVVDAVNFVQTIHANVDNTKLSDADFREFIRNSLPIVIFPRPEAKKA
jgi:hypothetical protein